ncbi:MAG: CvpA family protein [Roseburia sp.]|nr:CvpA family protein [Roseburia sp.]
MEINLLFIVVIIILGTGTILGCRRGFLESVVRIVSCILGILVVVIIAKGVGNFIQGSFLSVLMALILLVAIRIIHKVIKLLVDSLKLVRALPAGRLVDKLIGAAIGFAEAVVVLWLLFLLIGSFDLLHLSAWINEQVAENRFLRLLYYSNYIVALLK